MNLCIVLTRITGWQWLVRVLERREGRGRQRGVSATTRCIDDGIFAPNVTGRWTTDMSILVSERSLARPTEPLLKRHRFLSHLHYCIARSARHYTITQGYKWMSGHVEMESISHRQPSRRPCGRWSLAVWLKYLSLFYFIFEFCSLYPPRGKVMAVLSPNYDVLLDHYSYRGTSTIASSFDPNSDTSRPTIE